MMVLLEDEEAWFFWRILGLLEPSGACCGCGDSDAVEPANAWLSCCCGGSGESSERMPLR